MGYRGVHFALSDEDTDRLADAPSAEALVALICEDLEERYMGGDSPWACATDKAWDPIHRILGDGTLLYETGPHPLTFAVLGGIALDAGEDHTACITLPEQVAQVSAALEAVDRPWFEDRFARRAAEGLLGEYERPEDLEYAWTHFQDLKRFLAKAASAKRHVLFTVDA